MYAENFRGEQINGLLPIFESMKYHHPEVEEYFRELGVPEAVKVAQEFGQHLKDLEVQGTAARSTVQRAVHEDRTLNDIEEGKIKLWLFRAEAYPAMFGVPEDERVLLMAEILNGEMPQKLFDLYNERRADPSDL